MGVMIYDKDGYGKTMAQGYTYLRPVGSWDDNERESIHKILLN
jgi:hypothetical protein